ncbi:MAG: hypothetical protein ACOC22_04410 [bacterium]
MDLLEVQFIVCQYLEDLGVPKKYVYATRVDKREVSLDEDYLVNDCIVYIESEDISFVCDSDDGESILESAHKIAESLVGIR